MSDFSDRPLVAGSITGLRSFKVEKDGTLLGPATRRRFAPGENVAICTVYYWPYKHLIDHQVGQLSCGCGYYAYFDLEANPFHDPYGNVYGLIQGYGVTTVGTRGFRAEKAKLLALIRPPAGPRLGLLDRLARPLYKKTWPIFVGMQALIYGFFGGEYLVTEKLHFWSVFCFLGCLAGVFLLRLSIRSIEVSIRTKRGFNFESVTERYDVPVYDTIEDALKDFPMKAPPPAPSPACPDHDCEYYTWKGPFGPEHGEAS